jgi:hypothetical protein
MSGMIVCCSVSESPYKGLVESSHKALQGNALPQTVQYEQQHYAGASSSGDYGGTDENPNAWSESSPGMAADAAAPCSSPYAFMEMETVGLEGFPAIMAAAVAALPTPVWGELPSSLLPYPANDSIGPFTGWGCTPGSGSCEVTLYQGLAKNTTTQPLPYFVYRMQYGVVDTYDPDTAMNGSVSGVTCTAWICTIVQTGIVLPGQVIGPGGDINIPFPDTCPIPLTDIGNTWLNGDQYTAVIGQDPADYFAAIDVTVGTTTSVTP